MGSDKLIDNNRFSSRYFYSVLGLNLVLIFGFQISPFIILISLFLPMLFLVSRYANLLSKYLEKNDNQRFLNESYNYQFAEVRYYNVLNVFGGIKDSDTDELKGLYTKTKKSLVCFLLSFVSFVGCQIVYYSN